MQSPAGARAGLCIEGDLHMKHWIPMAVAAALVAGCGGGEPATEAAEPAADEPTTEAAAAPAPGPTLQAVLDAQPDEVKARYGWRHPEETLEFFGIEPGMTVVEGLPGGGWYT